MVPKYCLKPGVKAVDAQDEYVLFFSYGNRIIIKSAELAKFILPVCSTLTQPTTADAVLDQIASTGANQQQVTSVLKMLNARKLIDIITSDEAMHSELSELGYFFSRFASSQQEAQRRADETQSRKISIICDPVAIQSFSTAFENLGFKHVRQYHSVDPVLKPFTGFAAGGGSNLEPSIYDSKTVDDDLAVVVTTWGQQKDLLNINRLFFESKKVWFAVFLDFFGGTISPLFGLDGELCFQCFYDRKLSNLLHIDRYEFTIGWSADDIAALKMPASYQHMLANVTAQESAKLLSGLIETKLASGCLEMDFLNYRHDFHSVMPTPMCPVCSGYDLRPGSNDQERAF